MCLIGCAFAATWIDGLIRRPKQWWALVGMVQEAAMFLVESCFIVLCIRRDLKGYQGELTRPRLANINPIRKKNLLRTQCFGQIVFANAEANATLSSFFRNRYLPWHRLREVDYLARFHPTGHNLRQQCVQERATDGVSFVFAFEALLILSCWWWSICLNIQIFALTSKFWP